MSLSSVLLVAIMGLGVSKASLLVPSPRVDALSCGATTMSPGERVIIQSPNFPSNYNVDDRCQYELTCTPKESTYLEFICPTFQLESSADCTSDRLVLASKGDRQEKCGSDSPDGTVTADGWARLTFFSNAQTTSKGFRCYVWCREQTTTSTTTTSTTTTPTTTTPTTTTPTTTTPTTTTPTTTTPITTTPTTTTPTTTTPTTTTPTTSTPTTTPTTSPAC
ncbi:hypothetical protein SK128_005699 [Halocaridina rubra]|uniref:CUB domain-containing protein n=1 Tax=Halocaridina rubra TaxID=373956 RepID=A0AAN8WVP9_HALRR